MKKKIIGVLICMLLLATTIPLTTVAVVNKVEKKNMIPTMIGDENDPEIEDETGDTELGLLDIESAWFYEKEDEHEYLYTALKIKDLKETFNAVFSIRWMYNNEEYVSGLDTFFYREKIFRSGLPQRATYWQWKSMPECEGILDQNTGVITWKILKSNIGNPQKGDVLTHTKANAVPGFPVSFIFFFSGRDYRDFAPDAIGEYGQDYVIQY
ncbi:hypothetical protein MBGDN05_00691 [Thermoplasmatales archaeon SCGC AB-539-N05]|nr:hypothetical protein MBGDN05_00691 [Thermoplasmatales archaeon SCGC AB-539-N05]